MAHYRSGNWEMADPCMRYWAVAWLRSSLKSPLMERNQSTQNNSNNNKRTVNYNYGCEPVDYNLDYRETGSGKTFTIDSILGLPDTEGEAEGEEEEASLTSRLQGTEFPPKSTHPSTDAKSSHEEPLRCKDSSQSGNLQRSNHHRRHKRVRTIFSPEQLERLEAEFERQQYMVGPERLYLATSLRLSEAQVKVWFQNRRIKWRKQHLEQQRRLHLATSYNP